MTWLDFVPPHIYSALCATPSVPEHGFKSYSGFLIENDGKIRLAGAVWRVPGKTTLLSDCSNNTERTPWHGHPLALLEILRQRCKWQSTQVYAGLFRTSNIMKHAFLLFTVRVSVHRRFLDSPSWPLASNVSICSSSHRSCTLSWVSTFNSHVKRLWPMMSVTSMSI